MTFSTMMKFAASRARGLAGRAFAVGVLGIGLTGATAAQNLSVTGLADGQVLTSAVKVEAVVADSLQTRAVGFELQGPTSRRHIEMREPYVMFGDDALLDPNALPEGDYRVTVKVANSSWQVIAMETIDFSVDRSPQPPAEDEGDTEPVNDAGSGHNDDQGQTDTPPTPDDGVDFGMTLSGLPAGGVLASPAKVEAVVTKGEAHFVDFSLSGPRRSNHREMIEPYVFKGDNSKLNPSQFPAGEYTMKATAFDSGGRKLAARTVAFRIGSTPTNDDDNGSSGESSGDEGSSDDDPEPADQDSDNDNSQDGNDSGDPSDADDQDDADDTSDDQPQPIAPAELWLSGLTNGQVLTAPTKVEAGLTNGQPRSIDFRLSGPTSGYHRENHAPYVYKGDNSLLNPATLSAGNYSLKITALNDSGKTVDEIVVGFLVSPPADAGDDGSDDNGGDDASSGSSGGDSGNNNDGSNGSSGGNSGGNNDGSSGSSGGDNGNPTDAGDNGDTNEPADDSSDDPSDEPADEDGTEDDADNADDEYDYADDTPAEPGDLYADRDGLDEWGWSIINIPADVRRIYLSNLGDDANDGATPETAIKTLERAEELNKSLFGQPFAMLLHAGHKFENRLNLEMPQGATSKSTEQRPIVIGVYGEGPRPKVFGRLRVVKTRTINHLRVVGIQFAEGIDYHTPGTDILIEDCLFIESGVNINGFQGAIKDVRLRRNIVVDNFPRGGHSQGAYLDRIEGLLIEENVFDHNGWATPDQRTIFNHNIYVQSSSRDCVVIGNIITRGSSHGLQLRPGGTIEDNLFLRNASGVYAGRGQDGGVAYVRRNVFAEADDIGGGQNQRGWGYEIHATKRGTVEHNIFTDRQSNNPQPGMHAKPDYWQNNVDPIVVRHNRIVNWTKDDGRGVVINPVVGDGISLEVNNLVNGKSQVTGQEVPMVDPSRRYHGYVAEFGNGGGFDELIDRVRSRDRGEWNPKWSAKEISAWVRAGFSVSPSFD
ncbi:MAG: right-handed parallel beta-helix repeat-containing protein [Planctomycetota bacterium]